MLRGADSPNTCLRSRANRVSRACDRCRIRKIKVSSRYLSNHAHANDATQCNGKSHCNRCTLDDSICVYTRKRRPNDRAYSKEYVQLLEEQQAALIKGLKELYRRSSHGETLPDLQSGCKDNIFIHELLSSLNALTKEADPLDFDFDQTSSTAQNSRASSVCEAIQPQSCFPGMQTPALSRSPTTSSFSPSPPAPSIDNFEGLMKSFDDDELQMMQNLPLVRQKAIEPRSPGALTEPCFLGHVFSIGPTPDFVNPRDTFRSMPCHMMHAYTI